MKKINNTLNFFTYDYPFSGNDAPFIEDDIRHLSKIFKRINIIPIKKNKLLIKTFYKKKNIYFDYNLSKLFYSKVIIKIFFKSLFNIFLWNEIKKINRPFLFKKIFITIKENFFSDIVYHFVKNNSYITDKDIFYSFWSNFILLSFNKLKLENSFSRTLGSDLNGFILNDPFIAFAKSKFKKLKFTLILNYGHKNKLIKNKLIHPQKIIKSYIGMYPRNFKNKINKNKKKIFFLSCGSLIDVKDPLSIVEMLLNFAKYNKDIEVNYTCIGQGYLENKIKKKISENKNLIKFKYINFIPNLFTYLKSKKVDYILNFSHSEGIAFTNMEAMSCGIPVVCSNIPGNLELVNNKNGIIFNKDFDKNYLKIIKQISLNHRNYEKKLIKRKRAYLTIEKKFHRINNYKKFCDIIFSKFK